MRHIFVPPARAQIVCGYRSRGTRPRRKLAERHVALSSKSLSPAQRAFATMRAAVLERDQKSEMHNTLHSPIDLPIYNLERPKPKEGEILVKTAAAGVCHTDLHIILGHIPFPKPAVMGHELAGEIVEFGPNTSRDKIKSDTNSSSSSRSEPLKIGDKIIGTFIMPCGHCHQCENNQEDICETFFQQNRLKGCLLDGTTRLFDAGFHEHDGPHGDQAHSLHSHNDKSATCSAHSHDKKATTSHRTHSHQHNHQPKSYAMYSMSAFADYSVIPERAVHKLPDSLPYFESSIIGCALFTAYGAVKNGAKLELKDKQLVS